MLTISNGFLRDTVAKTAGARIAQSISQKLGPKYISAMQRLNSVGNLLAGVFGLRDAQVPIPLLGGMTFDETKRLVQDIQAAGPAKKCLYFVEIEDLTPPALSYGTTPTALSAIQTTPLSAAIGLLKGDPLSMLSKAISSGVSNLLGVTGSDAAGTAPPTDVGYLMHLFATEVSYSGATLTGDKVAIGSGTMDMLHGRDAVELTITTMDDEVGTLKRWFEAKCKQAAHMDGTVGLPADYIVNFTILHATPKASVNAFGSYFAMRPVSIQYDLSRNEDAPQSLTMVWTQFDTFVAP
jgi:hypothetical protein